MVCVWSCALAIIFIAGMVYTMYMSDKTELIQNFMNILTEEQRERYNRIREERLKIYYQGFGLGILFSLVIIFWNYKNSRKLNKLGLLCLVGGITMVTNYFYYILSPKSDWMIMHLNDDKQRFAWLHVYKNMQRNYHIGLVLGIVGVVFIGNMFC